MSFVHGSNVPPPREMDERIRILNLPLLIVSAAGLLFIGVALKKWHDWQVAGQAESLLAAAKEARAESRWPEVHKRLKRYLRLEPSDYEAMEIYAEAEARTATSRTDLTRSIQTYFDLIRLDPSRSKNWLPIAELQLAADLPKEALGAVTKYLETDPDDPHAMLIRAVATERLLDRGDKIPKEAVVDAYQAAWDKNPNDVRVASRLAMLLQNDAIQARVVTGSASETGPLAGGVPVMDKLVAHCDDKAQALFARYLFRRAFPGDGQFSTGGGDDLARALELAPEDPEILLAVARVQLEKLEQDSNQPSPGTLATFAAIEANLRKVMQKTPKDPRAYFALASIQVHWGDKEVAIKTIEEGRAHSEKVFPLFDALQAKLYMTAGRWEEAERMLRRLESSAPSILTAQEGKEGSLLANCLWADFYRAENNPRMNLDQAVHYLAAAAQGTNSSKALGELWHQQGDCYSALGDWDLATESYRRAVSVAPTSYASWIGLAESFRQRGQIDVALDRYRHVLRLMGATPQSGPILVAIVQLELLRLLSTPSTQRRWGEFDESLTAARRAYPMTCEILFLELQARFAREPSLVEDPARGLAVVTAALRENEELYWTQTAFWRSAFAWYWRVGARDLALRALENLEGLTGQRAFAERTRIAFAEEGYPTAQPIILEAREAMNPFLFSLYLTAVARDVQEWPRSLSWIEGMLLIDPDNLRLRGLLAERTAYAGDMTQLQKCDAELERLDGRDGPYARWSRIQVLLFESRTGMPERLFWAREETRKLFTSRSQWSLSMAALGTVAEMEGRIDEAISHFGDAYRSDHRDVMILAKYVSLLVLRERQDEARHVLRSLPDSRRIVPELLTMGVRLELEANELAEAVRISRLGVAAAPHQASPHILLGLSLLATADAQALAEADHEFYEACRVEPGQVTSWLTLLWYHLKSDHPERTLRVLQTVRKFAAMFRSGPDALGPEDQDYLLARCVELEGDFRFANELYRRSIQRRGSTFRHPLPPGVIYSMEIEAVPESEPAEQIKRIPVGARQTFGLLLATEPDEFSAEAALTFFEEDQRLSAIAAAVRGGPDQLRRAVTLMDGLSPGELRVGDCLFLAELHELTGRSPEALAAMRRLPALGASLERRLAWGELALRENAVAEAETALEGVEGSGQYQHEILKLRVRLLSRQGRQEAAVQLALEQARSPVFAADLLVAIGANERALALLDEARQTDQLLTLPYAELLARRPETLEQATECIEAISTESGTRAAALLAAKILARREGSAEVRQRLDRIVENALKGAPHSTDLFTALALARENEGNTVAALRLTRQALQVNPNDTASLNNLGWLLANYQGDANDALTAVERALRSGGPEYPILDTLASALLSLGRHDEAVRLLETCCVNEGAGISPWLHLAEAYRASGRKQDARRIFDSCRRGRIVPSNPRDQAAFARLEKTLYTEP